MKCCRNSKFSNLQEALDFMEDRIVTGRMKFEEILRDVKPLFPFREERLIHVAGTNGKGSTGAFVSSLLQEKGENVLHFTSPHVYQYTERFRYNGEPIDEEHFLQAMCMVEERLQCNSRIRPTYFLYSMMIASVLAEILGPDRIVLEAGIGGRRDSTNIYNAGYQIITPIGLDHKKTLGDTLPEIAYQKGGIFKRGSYALSAPQKREVERVLYFCAEQEGTDLDVIRKTGTWKKPNQFEYDWVTYTLSMPAKYQMENAITALEFIDRLSAKEGFFLNEAQRKRAIQKTVLPGRFSVLMKHPLFLSDGAHNAHGIRALDRSLPANRAILFFAMHKDKVTEKAFEDFSKTFRETYFIAMEDADYGFYAKHPDIPVLRTLDEAMSKIKPGETGVIVAAGSLYLAEFFQEVKHEYTDKSTENETAPFGSGTYHPGSVSHSVPGNVGI